MKMKNFRLLAFGLLAGPIALLGPMWIPVADAAPKIKAIYIPPTDMVVGCKNGSTGSAVVTANVPSRTKFMTYTFYKKDSIQWLQTYNPAAPDAYFGYESGPGWPASTDYAYTTQVGGDGIPIYAPADAEVVWAEAYSSDRAGAKPLAWGFAACGDGAAINFNIAIKSGATSLIRYYSNGALETYNP